MAAGRMAAGRFARRSTRQSRCQPEISQPCDDPLSYHYFMQPVRRHQFHNRNVCLKQFLDYAFLSEQVIHDIHSNMLISW